MARSKKRKNKKKGLAYIKMENLIEKKLQLHKTEDNRRKKYLFYFIVFTVLFFIGTGGLISSNFRFKEFGKLEVFVYLSFIVSILALIRGIRIRMQLIDKKFNVYDLIEILAGFLTIIFGFINFLDLFL